MLSWVKEKRKMEEIKRDTQTLGKGGAMEESIFQIAERLKKFCQEAYDIYLPLVEDVCSRKVSEDELSHLFDHLLDFAYDERILDLYKRVCRRYLYVYPNCVKFYIEEYRETWEDENKSLSERTMTQTHSPNFCNSLRK